MHRGKKTQHRGQSKKSQDGTYLGKSPNDPIESLCMVVALPDTIMCARFQNEIFRGYGFTGVEFPIFG